MKKIHLFATKPRYFCVTLPPLFVFILCLCYHSRVEGSIGLLPLAIAMLGVIAFCILFFARTVSISYEEMREGGLFSDHDHVDLMLGRELIVVVRPHHYLSVYAFGEDDSTEEFWLLNEAPRAHILMRSRVVGGKRTLRRILRYFKVDEEHLEALCTVADLHEEFEYVNVETSIEEEKHVVRILLKKEFELEE